MKWLKEEAQLYPCKAFSRPEQFRLGEKACFSCTTVDGIGKNKGWCHAHINFDWEKVFFFFFSPMKAQFGCIQISSRNGQKRTKHQSLSVQCIAPNFICWAGCRQGGEGRHATVHFWRKSDKGTVCWHSARLSSTNCTGFVWKRSVAAAGKWPKTESKQNNDFGTKTCACWSYSPDLNPIENILGHIKQQFYRKSNHRCWRNEARVYTNVGYYDARFPTNLCHKHASSNQRLQWQKRRNIWLLSTGQCIAQTLSLSFFLFIITVLLVFYFVSV